MEKRPETKDLPFCNTPLDTKWILFPPSLQNPPLLSVRSDGGRLNVSNAFLVIGSI